MSEAIVSDREMSPVFAGFVIESAADEFIERRELDDTELSAVIEVPVSPKTLEIELATCATGDVPVDEHVVELDEARILAKAFSYGVKDRYVGIMSEIGEFGATDSSVARSRGVSPSRIGQIKFRSRRFLKSRFMREYNEGMEGSGRDSVAIDRTKYFEEVSVARTFAVRDVHEQEDALISTYFNGDQTEPRSQKIIHALAAAIYEQLEVVRLGLDEMYLPSDYVWYRELKRLVLGSSFRRDVISDKNFVRALNKLSDEHKVRWTDDTDPYGEYPMLMLMSPDETPAD